MRQALLSIILVFTVAALALGSKALAAERRVALVIGNNDYQHSALPDLNNARADAEAMAAQLARFGFDVILAINADQVDMGRALADFETRLTKADVGLVFYAGHGIQAEGRNFLIPVDARLEREADLRFQGIDAAEILAALQFADVPTNILILDACRDNPLPQRSRSSARGLRALETALPSRGIAILYSAAPGQVAQDGPPGQHGVFTGALLKVLDTPGLKLEEVFKETAKRVAAETENAQDPFMTFNIKGDFVFNLTLANPPETAPPSSDLEALFWQTVKDSPQVSDFEAYLAQFPKGVFAGLARSRIAALAPSPPIAPPPAMLPSGPEAPPPGAVFRDCPTCPEMVVIPPGRFMMGPKAQELDWFVAQGAKAAWAQMEIPRHEITIDRAFAVGKYEITVGQYAAFVRNTSHTQSGPCRTWDHATKRWQSQPRVDWQHPGFDQTEYHPVVCVSWEDAAAYVAWLSQMTGAEYRLLSEAEWEYVARAGTGELRYWGDDWDNSRACTHANVADRKNGWKYGFACADGYRFTAPVGRFPANPFGLHDTLGNVWEWGADCWTDSYQGAPTDGRPRTDGQCGKRVDRGGSWYSHPRHTRASDRGAYSVVNRAAHLGFRVARTYSR